MDEYLATETITLKSALPPGQQVAILEDLLALTGVENVMLSSNHRELTIEFCPQVVSFDFIKAELCKAGCVVVEPVKEKNPFKRFLQSLINSNQKQFGNNPQLSCCKLRKDFKNKELASD